MPNNTDCSIEDETYIAAVMAEPKMTMDEVGADIETHGHVPVTPETATQNPFTAKGSLANALDEATDSIPSVDSNGAPDQGEYILPEKKLDGNTQLIDPSNDFRDETKGEIEGITDTPQAKGDTEPIVQQDSAAFVRDSLAAALDSVTMDAEPDAAKDPKDEIADYTEENASFIPQKSPDVPVSLGGDGSDKPDGNGLVYVTATFTVDPEKYVSPSYRPQGAGLNKPLTAKDIVNKPSAASKVEGSPIDAKGQETEEETVEVDETIPSDSAQAAADDKTAADEAIEKTVLDYATFLDGSSFLCFDEISNIDYSKIAMDAGPRKKVTRENCETTFAQCRAKNPLFCRFHGPKLLEADIKTQLSAFLGRRAKGCVVSVTKDKSAKTKFTFRLTVGCPPSLKGSVEKLVHMYMTQQPGIKSSQEDMKDISPTGDVKQLTQEFDMDILKADEAPKSKDNLAQASIYRTEDYGPEGKFGKRGIAQPTVGDTPEDIEKAAHGGVLPEPVDPSRQADPEPKTKPKKADPYSYQAYGDVPNLDESTAELYPGGTGDTTGAELLEYAAHRDGILQLPKGWKEYADAIRGWNDAMKRRGSFHGKPAMPHNRPKMSDYGIVDPMADWIDSFLDGGLAKRDRATFDAVFGKRRKYGSNDVSLDGATPEIQKLLEEDGMEGVVNAFLAARDKYREWVDKCKEAAKRRKQLKAEGKLPSQDQDWAEDSPDDEEVISLADIEARDLADAEYDNAWAEVVKFDLDSPEIRYFDRDQMKSLQKGDSLRFDHAEATFSVLGYDADNDVVTVIPQETADNPLMDTAEKEAAIKAFKISPEGITEIPYPYRGEENGREDENGTTQNSPSDAGITEGGTGTESQEPVAERTTEPVAESNGSEPTESITIEPVGGGGTGEGGGTGGGTGDVVLPKLTSAKPSEPEPQAEEKAESTAESQGTGSEPAETSEPKEPQAPTEADIANAAKIMAKATGYSVAAVKKDINNRLGGKKPITKPVMDFVNRALPQGNPIREAMQRLYESGGATDAVAKAEKSADVALKGNPSPEVRDAAKKVKDSAEKAKEQTRIANELGERLGTMSGGTGGIGDAVAKAAVEQAAVKAADNAASAEQAAVKAAESLEKKSESSYREAERVSKGKAAARVEQLLTAMAQSVFSNNSESDSIGEEADSIVGWLTKKANEKGIAYSVSDGIKEAVDAIKTEGEQLEWLMGNLQKEMNSTGTDFHEDDLNGLVDSIARKTAKISGAFAELTSMGIAEIARINRAAELAKQKAQLGGGTESGSRPSESEFQSAAMAIANSGGDVMDDAFSGLAAIIDGKVQGFGSMSSEAMTREMAEEYIKALENDSGNHEKMISALKEAVSKLPQEAVGGGSPEETGGGTAEEPQAENTAKAGTGAGSGDVSSRIAKVYEDWVGEDIPDWVSNLSDSEAAEYADLLEKASQWDDTQDVENTAFHALEEFESRHSKAAEEAKAANAEGSGESGGAEKGKTAEAEKVAETHGDIVAAAKRLGVDAYKPVAELKRILNQTKAHSQGNPRLEQKVKDIETVLADREAKKGQAPREGGRYVGDEMPKGAERLDMIAKLVVEALEG